MSTISPETAYSIGQMGIAAVVAAIVSAAFNAWSAHKNRKHDFEKDFVRRRQDVLERVVEHIETVDEEVSNMAVQLKVCSSAPIRSEAREEGRKQVLRLMAGLDKNVTTLNGDEGKLLLIGLVGSAKCLSDYQLVARSSFALIEQYDEKGFEDRLNALIDDLAGLRVDFFKRAALEYRSQKPICSQ